MIKVRIKKESNNISKIIINGHALYADYGSDIVCAAISSTVITTINGILSINNTIDCEQIDNKITINVIKEDEITFKLLENMINNLKELEIDYKSNIDIKEE